MAGETGIEWCDATFNPWWGCAEVSPGCAHCYAGVLARRYGYGDTWPEQGEEGSEREHDFRFFGDAHWAEPLRWARLLPARLGYRPRVFCASMADVFEDRPELEEPRLRLFTLIAATPELDWLILTKRPEFARDWLHRLLWDHERRAYLEPDDHWSRLDSAVAPLPNVWMGTSIENARYTWRADVLREIPAAVRFLSCEPLLGSLFKDSRIERDQRGLAAGVRFRAQPLDLTGIDWVIVGGESGGRKSRPMHPEWAREIRDACLAVSRCETCEGQGWTVETGTSWTLECCGRFSDQGECCNEPESVPYPEPIQAECRDCYHGERVGPRGELLRPAFFFKQHGSWGPSAKESSQTLYVATDGSKTADPWHDPSFAAERENPGERWKSLVRMYYLGVSPKSGGDRLDGREWKEFPQSKVETHERSAA